MVARAGLELRLEEEDSLRYRKDWRRAENKSRNSRGSGDGVARAKGNRWESTRYLCGWRQRRGWGVGQRVPRNQRRPREKGVPYRDQQENVETSQQREHLRDFPANPVVKTLHSQCRGHRFNPWSRN